MKLVKSEAGQRVLKDRSVPLTPRQRAAFILFDGRHTVDEVLAATQTVGVMREDVDHLLQLGLLERAASAAPAAAPVSQQPRAPEGETDERSRQERYQSAYPVAARLTGNLGLRGFRLNLAVEQAMNYQQLCELAPRIKEAVGPGAYLELHRALYN